MAKQYYTLQEAAAALKMTEEQVKAMARDGKLREFRDGGKLNYKVSEVDELAKKEGSSVIDLAVEGSGTISLADSDANISIADSDAVSLSGDDAPSTTKDDTKITNVGISVFDDDELQIEADPMAETSISSAIGDEISIGGGAGSGSGLMDLTRESDDTSLGAELLDVISPTEAPISETQTQTAFDHVEETMSAPAQGTMAGGGTDFGMDAASTPSSSSPRAAGDPVEGALTGLLFASVLIMTFMAFALSAGHANVWPAPLAFLTEGMNLYMYVIGGTVGVAAIAALVGFMMNKGGGSPRKPAKAKGR